MLFKNLKKNISPMQFITWSNQMLNKLNYKCFSYPKNKNAVLNPYSFFSNFNIKI